MSKYDYMTTAKNFFAETYLQTAATTAGYQTNNQMIVDNPHEFRIYDDKAIHGWLNKQGKSYFSMPSWKRVFVTVENQKLCYYAND